jgi:AraC-like DNA-binding protein
MRHPGFASEMFVELIAAQLAIELCKLSVRQLTRGFRVSRGCSIGDYVANNRIERAKRLLASAQSIKTIAYSLGFNSSSGFCFAFRRATGMTAGEFRACRAARGLTAIPSYTGCDSTLMAQWLGVCIHRLEEMRR